MPLLGQYEYIIDKTHPRANSEGAVYKHVIVAEEILGRPLFPQEVVHHRDLNKLNNSPDNIMVFASNSDHTRFHQNKLDEKYLVLNSDGVYFCKTEENKCLDCGVIISKWGARCKKCSMLNMRKAKRPSAKELFDLLSSNNGNFTEVGKMYNVTDNAVRKWCDFYKLPRKSKDYKTSKGE